MKNIIFSMLPMLIFAIGVNGQSSIDSVLVYIEKNNKTIIAHTKYWEAKELEYQTGLTPDNPKVEFDHLIGTPSNAGNQTDFAVTQSFDFPTAYSRKKQLSKEQIKQKEFQLAANRQEVLLEAKLICIELIYRNILKSELTNHRQNTEKWLFAFQRSMEKGEGNIMDVNKAKLQLIEVKAAFQKNLSISNQLNQKLTALNGGLPIQFSDSSYASPPNLLDFQTLKNEIESKDPIRKYMEQEKVIGQSEVELSKSLRLPKFEMGYYYQALLGQRFNGVHFGLTIPLWENRNTVETKQAELIYNEANLQEHINKKYYDVKQKYEHMTKLKITMDEYQTLFASINSAELLDKSLSLGEISTIEYFMEMSYYYEALKNYLKTQMEYHKVVAELYKYQL